MAALRRWVLAHVVDPVLGFLGRAVHRFRVPLRVLGVALAAALVVYLVGFTGFDAEARVQDPEPFAEDVRYVALGDSFSAGEGLGRYAKGTRDIGNGPGNNRCHRSAHAYGSLLGEDRGEAGLFEFRACSGALLEHIFDEDQHHGQGGAEVSTGGPQLADGGGRTDKALDPDVVTVTIGGNNAGFSKVVTFCALTSDCIEAPGFKLTDGSPEETVRQFAERQLPDIQRQLHERVYVPLRAWYPDARIVVLGYPLLFPETTGVSGQRRCLLHERLFDEGERKEIRALGARFNGLIAQQAVNDGLEYVDVAAAFSGHETCGPEGPWLGFLGADAREVGELLDGILSGSANPGEFHPTEDGQSMYGRLVGCYLDLHPTGRPYVDGYRADSAEVASVAGGVAVGVLGDEVHVCATG